MERVSLGKDRGLGGVGGIGGNVGVGRVSWVGILWVEGRISVGGIG